MDRSGVAVARLSGLRAVSRYQWLVFLVVWLGWTLDAADFGLYSLVLKPAMTELLGGNPSMADIGKYGRPLVAGLLVGAFGGSFNRVTAFMTCFALLSIIAMLLGRETMGDPLPIARLTPAACRLGPADRSGAWADPGSCGPRAGRF